jgi:hypothetical protein
MKKLLLIITIALLASCTTTRYVSVPEYHYRDSVRVVNHRDSIYQRDSVYLYVKGDTIYHEHYNTQYREFLHNDTLVINKVDSINKPYPVEKKLSSTQKYYLWIGSKEK